jgi:hypothetical protein
MLCVGKHSFCIVANPTYLFVRIATAESWGDCGKWEEFLLLGNLADRLGNYPA